MIRKATLGMVIEHDSVKTATADLEKMGTVGEASQKRVQAGLSATERQLKSITNSMRNMREASSANAMESMIRASDPFQRSFQKTEQAIDRVTTAADHSHLAIGRVNMALEGLAFETIGANAKLGSIGTKFFEFGAGGPITMAVLGGLALIALAWEKITEKAREAAKEQADAVARLAALAKQRKDGITGSTPDDVEAATKELMALKVRIARQQEYVRQADAITRGSLRADLAAMQAHERELQEGIDAGHAKIADIIREHNNQVTRDAEQAANEEFAAWKQGMQARIDAMRETEDVLTRLQREGAEARKRNSDLTEFGIGPRVTGTVGTIASAKIGADVFAELARVGARAKDGVERMTHAWEILAGIAKEEAEQARKRAVLGIGLSSASQLLSTFGGQGGQLVSGVASSAMQGFAVGGPPGAAIAGVTALITGIVGLGRASKEAAERMAAAQREFQFSFALYKKGAYGTVTDLDQQLEAERQRYQQVYDQIQSLYGGKKNETEREQLLAQAAKAHEAYNAQIKENIAAMEKAAKMDGFRRTIEGLTSLIDNLTGFRNEISLSPLSPLSPVQQLAEARRQYDDVLGKARGGDQTAAGQLPEFARRLLEVSRSVYASGSGYQQAYAQVLRDNDEITKLFEAQRSIAQQQLDVLMGIRDGSVEVAKQQHEDAADIKDAIERLIDATGDASTSVEPAVV